MELIMASQKETIFGGIKKCLANLMKWVARAHKDKTVCKN